MSFITSEKVKSVLLIDDDPSCNFILAEFINLVDKNIKKNQAYSVDEAFEVLRILEEFPEVIFLDLNMPVKSGFEFLNKYEKEYYPNHPRTKMVVLTSSLRPSDKEDTLAYNCVSDFRSKSEIDQFIYSCLNK